MPPRHSQKDRNMVIEAKYKNDLNLNNINNRMLMQIKDPDSKKRYIEETKELLQVYNHLRMKDTSVIDVEKMDPAERKNRFKRLIIIARYLERCEKYVEVVATRVEDDTPVCEECGSLIIHKDEIWVCENDECSMGDFSIEHNKHSFDGGGAFTNLANDGGGKDYDDSGMLKAMLIFQGKEKKVPPQEVIQKIKQYMKAKGIPLRVNISKMRIILESMGLKDYYGNVNYIHSQVTGIECPDISHLEDNILLRTRLIHEEASDLIQSNTRDKILLQYLTQMEGFSCDEGYFPEIKTAFVRDNYNIMMKLICDRMKTRDTSLTWNYRPL